MRTGLSASDLEGLPLHDAELISCHLETSPDGHLSFGLQLLINPEESLEAFRRLGIGGRLVQLTFGECLQVASNFLGLASPRAVLSAWEVMADSELVRRLCQGGGGQTPRLFHYRFSFSEGSALDVVGPQILLEGVVDETVWAARNISGCSSAGAHGET
jgi:hypothetical protein